ncbi:hypothetical protein GQR58_011909 [Nymphon striatum]|nr:hypothetical protein GQR58_011909 [Nymphon striatum]
MLLGNSSPNEKQDCRNYSKLMINFLEDIRSGHRLTPMKTLSKTIESVLPAVLSQELNRKFVNKFNVSDKMPVLNGSTNNLSSRSSVSSINEQDAAMQNENLVLLELKKQNSMDRMELTLKIPKRGHISDSDDSPVSSRVPTRSCSHESIASTCSTVSSECIPDEKEKFAQDFMKYFTTKLFTNCQTLTYEEKAKFGAACRDEAGRRWFSRFMNSQRVHSKRFNEMTFFSLIQHFSIVLFECSEYDDFSTAKSLMNMAFTFYYKDYSGKKEFILEYLKDQPIWHSLRYWNAAYFEAVQTERENKPMITRSVALTKKKTFVWFHAFTFNMQAFGLSKQCCLEFLRKQSYIANLSPEQDSLLAENVHKMFAKPI